MLKNGKGKIIIIFWEDKGHILKCLPKRDRVSVTAVWTKQMNELKTSKAPTSNMFVKIMFTTSIKIGFQILSMVHRIYLLMFRICFEHDTDFNWDLSPNWKRDESRCFNRKYLNLGTTFSLVLKLRNYYNVTGLTRYIISISVFNPLRVNLYILGH